MSSKVDHEPSPQSLHSAHAALLPLSLFLAATTAGNDFAGCRFCFDPFRLDSGNFTAGSMDGEVLTGNLIRPPGEDNPDYTRCVFAPHAGPLVALCVSPFLPDVLLSVGDWSFRLWQGVESKVPVFTSPYAEEAYTAGGRGVLVGDAVRQHEFGSRQQGMPLAAGWPAVSCNA